MVINYFKVCVCGQRLLSTEPLNVNCLALIFFRVAENFIGVNTSVADHLGRDKQEKTEI